MKKIIILTLFSLLLITGCQNKLDLINTDAVYGKWVESSSDMMFEFDKNNTYKWYRSSTLTTDDYYYGAVKIYYNDNAIKKLTEIGGNPDFREDYETKGFKDHYAFFVIFELNEQGVVSSTTLKPGDYKKKTTPNYLIMVMEKDEKRMYGLNVETGSTYNLILKEDN